MLGERLGHPFDKPLENIIRKIPLAPNTITVTGFIVTLLGAAVLKDDLLRGGIIILAGGLFDVLDGIVARVNAKSSLFGAFLDSVLDRYSDAFILLGIGWNLFHRGNLTGVVLCLGTLVGAFLISYVRARAEGLGKECKTGLMERPERVILIALGAITGFIIPVLWVLVVLTHFTVLQRVYHVWHLT